MRRLLILLAGLVALAWPLTAAHAHSSLLDGSPGPGDEIAAGTTTVALEFDDVDPGGEHQIAVLDAEDEPLSVGEPQAQQGRLVCVRTEELRPGVHAVEYSVTSADGHVIRSRYQFEVVEGGAEADDLGCDADALAAPSGAESLGFGLDLPPAVLAIIAVAVVGSAALAVTAVLRSRRAEDD